MKKELSKFTLRAITGILYISVILALIIFDNKYLAISITGFASLLSVYEYFNCVGMKRSPYMLFGIILSIITTASLIVFREKVFVHFSSAIIFIMAISFIIGILFKGKYSYKDISVAIVGYIYTIFLITFLSRIFFTSQGNIKVALLIGIVTATDTFAFLIGRKFGKHKFSEISPKKSIEGSVAGIISAVIFVLIYTFIVNKYYAFNLNYYIMVLVAIGLSIISQIGDLVASFIKRQYGIKDFGNILVGHGGVLDRIDSLIFAAPFAYLIIYFLM